MRRRDPPPHRYAMRAHTWARDDTDDERKQRTGVINMSGFDLVVGDSELIGDAVEELLRGYGEEIQGDEMGYGDEIQGDELGAARGRRRGGGGGGKVVAATKKLALGIGSTNIATLTSAVITVTPQCPFRLSRFTTPVVGLQVLDIKVGTNSQFVGSGSIPIETFAKDAVGIELKGDTAVPGVDIALSLSNPTNATVAATGAYIGFAA
jgi:hypothetical protein